MYFDINYFNNIRLFYISDTDNSFKCIAYDVKNEKDVIYMMNNDKKERNKILGSVRYYKKKNKIFKHEKLVFMAKFGIILNNNNIILDVFRRRCCNINLTKDSRKKIMNRWLNNKNGYEINRIIQGVNYYKKKNMPIPDSFLKRAKAVNYTIKNINPKIKSTC